MAGRTSRKQMSAPPDEPSRAPATLPVHASPFGATVATPSHVAPPFEGHLPAVPSQARIHRAALGGGRKPRGDDQAPIVPQGCSGRTGQVRVCSGRPTAVRTADGDKTDR
jgi:hypothetical protein